MPNFVLIANPQSRRVELFQQALARLDLPPARLVPYGDLLADRVELTQFDSPATIFRFDAPERDFSVDRGLIAAGAELEPDGIHQRIEAIAALQLPVDRGRIWYQRQWYLGWCDRLRSWTQHLQGQILNHPTDIEIAFDKVRCQQLLAAAGITIAPGLSDEPISSYDELCNLMDERHVRKVFIKLAHGSSASGVVAYERQQGLERAITTVERVRESGELRFYNSRSIRQYRDSQQIAEIIDFLAAESVRVETWLPKARLSGKEFDVRVVVIAGKAYQSVIRIGNSPMTNLHLGNDRREISHLPIGLTDRDWENMLATCERAAACFSRSFYLGIDLLIAPNLQDHYIIEVNAFGDLLQGISWNGEDTYTTQLRILMEQKD